MEEPLRRFFRPARALSWPAHALRAHKVNWESVRRELCNAPAAVPANWQSRRCHERRKVLAGKWRTACLPARTRGQAQLS